MYQVYYFYVDVARIAELGREELQGMEGKIKRKARPNERAKARQVEENEPNNSCEPLFFPLLFHTVSVLNTKRSSY